MALTRSPGSFLRHCSPPAAFTFAAVLLSLAAPAEAAESVKIYRSTMPDGSVMLSDKPLAGAKAVVSNTYVLKAPSGAADAEREYWRRQAEAFNLRQQQRDLEAARSDIGPRRVRGRDAPDDQPVTYYSFATPGAYRPFMSLHRMGHHGKPIQTWHGRGDGRRGGPSIGTGSGFPRQGVAGSGFPR